MNNLDAKQPNFFSAMADIREVCCANRVSVNSDKLTYIDLFAGCGGLSLGLEMAGLKCLGAVEIKEYASETYMRNLGHKVITDDITLPETKQKLVDMVMDVSHGRGVDIVAGGPPCQGFSMAGKRSDDDPRNRLYAEYLDVIRMLKPSYAIMENVEGLMTMAHGAVIRHILSDFEHLGYTASVRVLNAADYGVPQQRRRMIIIANRVGVINMHPAPLLKPSEYRTVYNAIYDLMYDRYDRAFSHIKCEHNPKKIEEIRLLRPGECLSAKYKGSYRKLYWDRPSYTVKWNNGGPDIHPELPRVLTLREMARLQSFPDWFLFYGSMQDQGIMIGNAVPPLLGKAIGLAILKMEKERFQRQPKAV